MEIRPKGKSIAANGTISKSKHCNICFAPIRGAPHWVRPEDNRMAHADCVLKKGISAPDLYRLFGYKLVGVRI